MMKTVSVIVCLSILATICTSLPAYNTRMERQYWKGRFSRNLVPLQGRFSRDSIPQYWKGRFSRRDEIEIPQYWKGRFSRDEIPGLEDESNFIDANEDDKREIAGPMLAREVQSDLNEPFNDQYWKGRFMRLRGGHKRQFSRGMATGQSKYGMRDNIIQQEEREALPSQEEGEEEEEEEERNSLIPKFHSMENHEEHETEEKRQEEEEQEEEEREMKDKDMQGRFARQGRFKKDEDLDDLDSADSVAQGRF